MKTWQTEPLAYRNALVDNQATNVVPFPAEVMRPVAFERAIQDAEDHLARARAASAEVERLLSQARGAVR